MLTQRMFVPEGRNKSPRAYEGMNNKAIQVWDWDDAPEEYKALSPHGGDEDWVALVPPKYAGRWIGWMESGSAFGCCDVSEHELPDGSVVRIGAHS